MDYKEIYNQWLENPYFDEATKEELKAIKDDENEIKERFYMDLEFGTAGLRGIIGAGTNVINIYVLSTPTTGLPIILPRLTRNPRELLSHMIPVICHRSLPRKQHFVWQQMGSRLISLRHFVRHRSFPLQYVIWAVWQVST